MFITVAGRFFMQSLYKYEEYFKMRNETYPDFIATFGVGVAHPGGFLPTKKYFSAWEKEKGCTI